MPRKGRGTQEAEPEPSAQAEQREIQPGEGVEIHVGRLESGEWYGRIGDAGDESAIAQTSAFIWEVLRGLVRQVKEADLTPFRVASDQQMGLCEHVTSDGRMCAVLECPIGGAEAVALALREGGGDGTTPTTFTSDREIVRLYGRLEKPRRVGEKEDDELTVTVKVTGEDLNPEYGYLREEEGKQVVAILYRGIVPAKPADVPLGQTSLPLDGEPVVATVEVLWCPVCEHTVHAEGQEPGMTCPLCENGILEITTRPADEMGSEPSSEPADKAGQPEEEAQNAEAQEGATD
jgi:hypothetical protein